MGCGDNTRATLITRGLAEITRLGAALGADQHTFAGLAGLGDLVATCSSPLSRNRTFGELLGRGMAVADVAAVTTQVAEGAKSAEPILELAQAHGVEMPITEVVVGVIHGRITVDQAAMLLTSRSAKPERYGVYRPQPSRREARTSHSPVRREARTPARCTCRRRRSRRSSRWARRSTGPRPSPSPPAPSTRRC